MKSKLILILKGGLGNQLFQLLAVLTYAKNNNFDVIEIYPHNLKNFKVKRNFNLDFLHHLTAFKFEVSRKENLFYREGIFRLFSIFSGRIITENNFNRKNNLSKVILSGYFQSNNFFSDNSVKLLKDAHNKYCLEKNVFLDTDYKFDYTNDLALHIRGGDFLNIDYYVKVNPISVLKNIACNFNRIIVFTDDILYAKKLLLDLYDLKFIYFKAPLEMSLYDEFTLFTKFQNKIISNSTFALFAAILGPLAPNSTVFAPSSWINDEKANGELINICRKFGFTFFDE